MALPIISAQERLAERKGVKLLMLGKSGIGKTSRLKDLDPATTLFLDIEAGDLAVAAPAGGVVATGTKSSSWLSTPLAPSITMMAASTAVRVR